MIKSDEGNEYLITYDSLQEWAAAARPHVETYLARHAGRFKRDWHGVGSWQEVESLALNGWQEEAETAMSVAESAISKVEREHTVPSFRAVWDVAGCEVDVARYLSNEPENMIDYEVTPATRAGRVIVLCASVVHSGSVHTDTIKRRGHVVAALAFALSELGYNVELWAAISTGNARRKQHTKCLVKGANDELDPAKVMFAFSHPAMGRGIGLPAIHQAPKGWHRDLGLIGGGYGPIESVKRDLPEGTIYLSGVTSSRDVPDADVELERYMRELGVIED
jgi:hypothetical protein